MNFIKENSLETPYFKSVLGAEDFQLQIYLKNDLLYVKELHKTTTYKGTFGS